LRQLLRQRAARKRHQERTSDTQVADLEVKREKRVIRVSARVMP
jgi:hypothetical protein